MGSAEIRSLLQEARFAADPKSGGLSDYHDLQDLLQKVVGAAEWLLDEREQLNRRLRRSSLEQLLRTPGRNTIPNGAVYDSRHRAED